MVGNSSVRDCCEFVGNAPCVGYVEACRLNIDGGESRFSEAVHKFRACVVGELDHSCGDAYCYEFNASKRTGRGEDRKSIATTRGR